MQQPLIGQGLKLQMLSMLWIWNKAAGRQTFSLKPLQSSSHFTSRTKAEDSRISDLSICMPRHRCGQNWLWREAQFCVINLTCKWRNMNQSERVFVWGQSENDANWSDTSIPEPAFHYGHLVRSWLVCLNSIPWSKPTEFCQMCIYIYTGDLDTSNLSAKGVHIPLKRQFNWYYFIWIWWL